MAAVEGVVTIVGGGIVGAACALWLTRAGLRVRVLEAGTPGLGATAEGMGHLIALDHDPATLALTQRSLELWHALAPELPAAAQWSCAGTLWVAEDARQLEHAAARAEILRAAGVQAELVAAAQLQVLEPCLASDLHGGLRVPGDRVIYPPVVAAWLLARARALGAELITDAPVLHIEQREVGGGARGETLILADGRRFEAACVVLAAGLGSGPLLGDHPLAQALAPRRGHLIITERTRLKVAHQLVELGYHDSVAARGEASVAFNLQPRASEQLLLGSSREDGVDGRSVERSVLARMVERGRRFVPALGALRALRAWVGMRPATRDGLPLIGALPGRPTLHLACGHEGLGITTSLGTAELVCAAVAGAPTRLAAAAFAPARLLEEAEHAA